MTAPLSTARDPLIDAYAEIADFYDSLAAHEDQWLGKVGAYRRLVRRVYQSIIPQGHRVLEIGCGRGDLLASLKPSHGVGVDVSGAMVAAARERHPDLRVVHEAGERFAGPEPFDYIVLSDVAPYVYDLQLLFETVAAHTHPRSRVVLNTFSNAWRPLLSVLSQLRLRPRHPIRNWVAPGDLENLFQLAGLEVVARRREILLPMQMPGLSSLANGLAARAPGLRTFTASYWCIARPMPKPHSQASVSVVVPCRNEAGSIDEIVDRIPDMGSDTEIIFVEGGSVDDTRGRISAAIARRSDRTIKLLVQSGEGKRNAIREAFSVADSEIFMILDGDLTVTPEDLPKFYAGLVSGQGELMIGARLVYGMEPGAMRFLNLLGNKLFAWLMTFVLGQYAKDTLCGTKALFRADYERMLARLCEFRRDDPFGDFELLLGAALLGMRIINVPVRYQARAYGRSQINRVPDAAKLFKLAFAGYRRVWWRPVAGQPRASGRPARPRVRSPHA